MRLHATDVSLSPLDCTTGQIDNLSGKRSGPMATITTTVIYENGVLRPLEKLDLPEHQKAQVTIEPIPSEEGTS
jgi:hypothetical protein